MLERDLTYFNKKNIFFEFMSVNFNSKTKFECPFVLDRQNK